MNITLRGWNRQVTCHSHKIRPVQRSKSSYTLIRDSESIRWENSERALGRIDNLGLTGNFLIELSFDESELRSWLYQYTKEHPQKALKLLLEMQGEAIVSLSSVK